MSSGSKEHIGKVAYIDEDLNYYAGGFMGIVRTNPHKCLSKYLYYYLLFSPNYKEKIKTLTQGANIHNISNNLNDFEIPLPSLEEQQKIVSELDSYQRIIDGAREIINNYIPHLPINLDFEIVKLSDVCEINKYSIVPEKEFGENYFTYIDISSVGNIDGKINKSTKIKGINAPSRARRKFHKGDVLMSTVRPNLKAFTYIDFDSTDFVASTGFAVLTPKNINGKYLLYILLDAYVGNQLELLMSKAMYPSVNKSDLENLKIAVPPITEQERIVHQLEEEKSLIESSKKIVETFTKKIMDKMQEILGE